MTEICLKVLSYEKTSRQKEQLITQLKSQLEEEKVQTLSYEIKFKEINKAHSKFIDLKNELNKSINPLQESLTDKEEKLKLLENINMEKEEEILSLKKKLSQNANLLQESLIDREEKLKVLKNINNEKESEILFLKEKLSQNVNLLQESLNDRDEKLKSLENMNMEKIKLQKILKILYLNLRESRALIYLKIQKKERYILEFLWI